MSLCAANSGPLSVVMVYRQSLYGSSSFLTTFARGFNCFPNGSFRISGILVDFSTGVSMACWSGSTIKPNSKSLNLFPQLPCFFHGCSPFPWLEDVYSWDDACTSFYALCAWQAPLLCHCGWCCRCSHRYPHVLMNLSFVKSIHFLWQNKIEK